jgi:hypothetical protein
MKSIIAAIGLGLLVTACADMPAAEITSMSDSQIGVVYYTSISGMDRATQIATEHCSPMGAEPVGRSTATGAPDRTVVTFDCK